MRGRGAVDPEEVWALADRLGYDADLTWSAGCGVDGRFDADASDPVPGIEIERLALKILIRGLWRWRRVSADQPTVR